MLIKLDPAASNMDEIVNNIKRGLVQIATGILEVGKWLTVAKSQIPYGQWQEWLKTNFNLTDRTARNYMRAYERFGKTESVFRFQASQMLSLLALRESDTPEFIAEMARQGKPVEDMPVRQLQAEIKNWKQQDSPQPLLLFPETYTAKPVEIQQVEGKITLNGDEIVTYAKAALILNRSYNAIRKLARRGRLTKVKIGCSSFVTLSSVMRLNSEVE